jgi:hypothetical protein
MFIYNYCEYMAEVTTSEVQIYANDGGARSERLNYFNSISYDVANNRAGMKTY